MRGTVSKHWGGEWWRKHLTSTPDILKLHATHPWACMLACTHITYAHTSHMHVQEKEKKTWTAPESQWDNQKRGRLNSKTWVDVGTTFHLESSSPYIISENTLNCCDLFRCFYIVILTLQNNMPKMMQQECTFWTLLLSLLVNQLLKCQLWRWHYCLEFFKCRRSSHVRQLKEQTASHYPAACHI